MPWTFMGCMSYKSSLVYQKHRAPQDSVWYATDGDATQTRNPNPCEASRPKRNTALVVPAYFLASVSFLRHTTCDAALPDRTTTTPIQRGCVSNACISVYQKHNRDRTPRAPHTPPPRGPTRIAPQIWSACSPKAKTVTTQTDKPTASNRMALQRNPCHLRHSHRATLLYRHILHRT